MTAFPVPSSAFAILRMWIPPSSGADIRQCALCPLSDQKSRSALLLLPHPKRCSVPFKSPHLATNAPSHESACLAHVPACGPRDSPQTAHETIGVDRYAAPQFGRDNASHTSDTSAPSENSPHALSPMIVQSALPTCGAN